MIQMLENFHLQQNTLSIDIYQLKIKWATCFMKMTFTLGIRSTQLSESFNRDLKSHMTRDMHLIDFFKQFDRVVERKRNNKIDADFKA